MDELPPSISMGRVTGGALPQIETMMTLHGDGARTILAEKGARLLVQADLSGAEAMRNGIRDNSSRRDRSNSESQSAPGGE
jgi:hypothetical protein